MSLELGRFFGKKPFNEIEHCISVGEEREQKVTQNIPDLLKAVENNDLNTQARFDTEIDTLSLGDSRWSVENGLRLSRRIRCFTTISLVDKSNAGEYYYIADELRLTARRHFLRGISDMQEITGKIIDPEWAWKVSCDILRGKFSQDDRIYFVTNPPIF